VGAAEVVAGRSLSSAEARRIALAAQGFDSPKSSAPPNLGHVRRLIARLGLVQLDSVNVLVRSHYLPLFSRLGPYAVDLLDRAAYAGSRRTLFEYWAHEASLLPLGMHPLLRWRMERARRGEGTWRHVAQFGKERRAFINSVLAEIRARGPLGVSELRQGGRGRGSWWGWSDGKVALEWLFWVGEITTVRRRNFERVYDLTERALPGAVLSMPTPTVADAHRELVRIAARALGVATERDLRDYFRLPAADAKARVAELVESGSLMPVTVEGWKQGAFLDPSARLPRRVAARALLSPFDSLIWERQRTERLFGFRYRLEIYTPAHKRTHGYYVLPFLLCEDLVARVDLKADRTQGTLRVIAVHAEAGVNLRAVAEALAGELGSMARWLGLARVRVSARDRLAALVRTALTVRSE
jgi:uncharacterized protein